MTLKTESQNHKIAAYIRVSTEEQAENPEGSIKNQEERIRQIVRFKNQDGNFGAIAGVYIDRAKSGKDTNRPELQKLLQAIRNREVTLLIVTELSRLSRSIKDFSEIWELMQKSGCQFMSLRESFDTTTAAGEMMMFSIANFAQFERRQVSERVAANFQARAARGLYNGGVLPIGYKLILDKPGYLDIDPDQAELVKKCFEAILMQGSLTSGAKHLNQQDLKVKRSSQGGLKIRLGHFTIENLKHIVTNRAYLGLRSFKNRSEVKEVNATWPAIIDESTFNAVQDILKKNQKRKPESESRYPYLLSGLMKCEQCNHAMVGKSAHGNGGKIPYYEHSWATRKDGCLVQKALRCSPFRVSAKKLESEVWSQVFRLITQSEIAKSIVNEAHTIHLNRSENKEQEKIKSRTKSIEQQIEVLAERLANLPATISPDPIYRQMEKLEESKKIESSKLQGTGNGISFEKPVAFKDYQNFLNSLGGLMAREESATPKSNIVQALIQKIVVTKDGFNLHYYVGTGNTNPPLTPRGQPTENLFLVGGSNKLTNGGP